MRREAEAAEEDRRKAERDAKLRRVQEDKGKAEEERSKRAMFNSRVANGGAPGDFEAAWPNLRREMLAQRTLEREAGAREAHRAASRSAVIFTRQIYLSEVVQKPKGPGPCHRGGYRARPQSNGPVPPATNSATVSAVQLRAACRVEPSPAGGILTSSAVTSLSCGPGSGGVSAPAGAAFRLPPYFACTLVCLLYFLRIYVISLA
jgi:hypothetical protein